MTRVLFLCVHNSARSPMAEALLNYLGKGAFFVESAGFEPRPINPMCITVMQEIGLDISHNEVKEVFDLYRAGRVYDYIISVCDEMHHENAPFSPEWLHG